MKLYIANNGEIACKPHARGSLPDWQPMSGVDHQWFADQGTSVKCETCDAIERRIKGAS